MTNLKNNNRKNSQMNANASKKEKWMMNYKRVKDFYERNGHLTIKDITLCQWLSYQRNHAMLDDEQQKLLEEINYKSTKMHQEEDEIKWNKNFQKLVEYMNTKEGRKEDQKNDYAKVWMSKQKRLLKNNMLNEERQKKLRSLGINLELSARKNLSSSMHNNQWEASFKKLKRHKETHGDCNVPRRYEENKSLGYWVSNQQKAYKNWKQGIGNMDPLRIDKLNN